ncbi:hypothetical protein [Vibrio barjaei]|uniref:hypothetical protein n=1 Tax=Vibrio barjaei TaxID=1676683 RepID=UPI002284CE92|nr:hypothetical protein [Vibrio barjaei]MCY9870440.1 hypothetical protein [Vibrio barjaei]
MHKIIENFLNPTISRECDMPWEHKLYFMENIGPTNTLRTLLSGEFNSFTVMQFETRKTMCFGLIKYNGFTQEPQDAILTLSGNAGKRFEFKGRLTSTTVEATTEIDNTDVRELFQNNDSIEIGVRLLESGEMFTRTIKTGMSPNIIKGYFQPGAELINRVQQT